MGLKDVEKTELILVIYDKIVHFKKEKNNKYIIRAGKNVYKFDSFNKAINANVLKSRFSEWLNLKEIDRILCYYDKIRKIELKGLEEGRDIFIDCKNNIDTYNDDYDDENLDEEIEW